ncbi:MAG: NAD(P)/FAD-dependent oxidoreductase [Candidatus Aminicenantes bacterium]|nr:MAG: NAD(P)/FAD-dependent oxidoreductase [Candidatus Aminicenantes bacterium]
MKKRTAIVGAGVMGLMLAYELIKKGYDVTLFERDDRIGGMSASFDFDGLTVERYYHFFCKSDTPIFELLKELGIDCLLKWKETRMGFFYQGKLYKWGNPLALLFFPRLGLISKIRFGLQVFLCTRKDKWEKLDRVTAVRWAKDFVGERAYHILWESLFSLKFHWFSDQISAAWVWRRLRRVGRSRKNIFTERLAYLEGGVDKLLSGLQRRINDGGGKIVLEAEVSHINIDKKKNKITGITVNRQEHPFDRVITTIPLPYIPGIAPGLPGKVIEKYKRLDNIGVVCVILKLSQPLTENFWLNISDSGIELPGLIEFTNLNPLPEKLVYFPFYLPRTHEKFWKADVYFIDEVLGYCKRINNNFDESWVLSKVVHRYEYAQPVCPPGFLERLPPIKTGIEGLYIMDTSYYYPEDRSISESVNAADKLVEMIGKAG